MNYSYAQRYSANREKKTQQKILEERKNRNVMGDTKNSFYPLGLLQNESNIAI